MTADEMRMLRDYLAKHEGREDRVYIDTEGHPTIGIGFNLDRPDARRTLTALGLDFEQVRAGRQTLTGSQIDRLFERTIAEAVNGAKRQVKDFDSLPREVKTVVVDMVYQMGETGFRQWQQTRAAINRADYALAADLVAKTPYAKKCEGRALDHVAMLRKAGRRRPPEAPWPPYRNDPFAGQRDTTKHLLPEAWQLLLDTGFTGHLGQRRSALRASGDTHLGQPGTPGFAGKGASREALGSTGYGVAVDVHARRSEGWPVIQQRLERMWRAGFAAWYRSARDKRGFPEHIHAVYAGYPTPNDAVAGQIKAFREGRVGLASNSQVLFEDRYPELALPRWAREWIGAIADLRFVVAPRALAYLHRVAAGAADPDPQALRAFTGRWKLASHGGTRDCLVTRDDAVYCSLTDWARYLGVDPAQVSPPASQPLRIDGVVYWPLRALAQDRGLDLEFQGGGIRAVRRPPTALPAAPAASAGAVAPSVAQPGDGPPATIIPPATAPTRSSPPLSAAPRPSPLGPPAPEGEPFGPAGGAPPPRLGPPEPLRAPEPLRFGPAALVAPPPMPDLGPAFPSGLDLRPHRSRPRSDALLDVADQYPLSSVLLADPPLTVEDVDRRIRTIVAAEIDDYDRRLMGSV